MHPFILLALALPVLVSSCTAVDPAFATLESKVLTSPAPDAVVGMWYRKQGEAAFKAKSVDSRLFRADGTGNYRTMISALGDASHGDGTFTWKYDGGGWWTIYFAGAQSSFRTRITGREMLDYVGDSRMIYVRSD